MKWYKKRKFKFLIIIILVLVGVRIAIEPIVLKKLNSKLSSFSSDITLQIEDLDFHFYRGAYEFLGVTGKLKGQEGNFSSVSSIDVSVAWRELIKGKIVTDIVVKELNFTYSDKLKNAFSNIPKKKEETTNVKDKLFPVKIQSVEITKSSVTLDEYPSLSDDKKLKISNIEGELKNLTPDKKNPLSSFEIYMSLLGDTKITTTGSLSLLDKPLKWDVNTSFEGLDLTEANQFLRKKVPLTFTKGSLDFYLEAKSEDGSMVGYAKPFFNKLDVVKKEEDFKGAKHWFVEIITAVGNFVLKSSDQKSVATKIPFSFNDKGFHIDTGKALSKAIEHGFKDKLSPGIENKYEIK